MGERERRIGRNEALFREVNERVEHLNESFDVADEPMALLCECGDDRCFEKIELTREEYERVRADPTLFAFVAGHEEPDIEEVVDANDRFVTVRKRQGEPARLAIELDPRS
jgi:hypothetical protein